MEQSPQTGPHAPKGDPAAPRDALLQFAGDSKLSPRDDCADGYLKFIARQYNIELTRPTHRTAVVALSRVAATATAYANALRQLNAMLPGYANFEALQRLPDGSRRAVVAGPLLMADASTATALQDDFAMALAPELGIPLSERPEDMLLPTIERAAAMARLFSADSSRYAGDLKAGGRGRHNADREGRSAKQLLVESCYLLVAGRLGKEGEAKIATTQKLTGSRSNMQPLFVGFVRAMHIYARNTTPSKSSFERPIKDSVAAMADYLSKHPEIYGFIQPPHDDAAKMLAKRGAETFVRFVTDPAARPQTKSTS